MTGFHNNNFNDRQGGFHDRDGGQNQRGGQRNWRDNEDAGERRNFQPRGAGNFERKGSRWTGSQRDEDWDDQDQDQQQQQQQDQEENQQEDRSSQQEESSRKEETLNDNGGENFEQEYQQQEKHEELPPGTEDQFSNEPLNDQSQPEECFPSHNINNSNNVEEPLTSADGGGCGGDTSGGGCDENLGNTTPLCDEEETKE